MTTRSSRPVGVSAMRFAVGTSSSMSVSVTRWMTTSPSSSRAASSLPISNEVPTTGRSALNASPRVGFRVSVRPSWPSLKMMTPAAPASKAFCALTEKSHVPRCTRAMLPAVKSTKSSGSHPLVDVLASAPGGSTRSTACSGASTSPLPEYSAVKKSSPGT